MLSAESKSPPAVTELRRYVVTKLESFYASDAIRFMLGPQLDL